MVALKGKKENIHTTLTFCYRVIIVYGWIFRNWAIKI